MYDHLEWEYKGTNHESIPVGRRGEKGAKCNKLTKTATPKIGLVIRRNFDNCFKQLYKWRYIYIYIQYINVCASLYTYLWYIIFNKCLRFIHRCVLIWQNLFMWNVIIVIVNYKNCKYNLLSYKVQCLQFFEAFNSIVSSVFLQSLSFLAPVVNKVCTWHLF